MALIQIITNFLRKKQNFGSIFKANKIRVLNFNPVIFFSLIIFFSIAFFTINNLIKQKSIENQKHCAVPRRFFWVRANPCWVQCIFCAGYSHARFTFRSVLGRPITGISTYEMRGGNKIRSNGITYATQQCHRVCFHANWLAQGLRPASCNSVFVFKWFAACLGFVDLYCGQPKEIFGTSVFGP